MINCRRYGGTSRAHGFTLIELLLVMGLLMVLLVMGVPSWRGSVERSEVGAVQQDLLRQLALARSESVRRGSSVTLCIGTAAGGCSASPAVEWAAGWILFSDPNENHDLDVGEELIRQHDPVSAVTVRLSAGTIVRYLTYQASGAIASVGGTFTICPKSGDLFQARGLIYNSGGRMRMSEDSNTPPDGVHDDGAGTNLTCP